MKNYIYIKNKFLQTKLDNNVNTHQRIKLRPLYEF